MSFIFPHQQRTVAVPAGQSIIIGNFKGAYLEVLNGKIGQPRAPVYRVLQNTAGELLGPYTVDVTLVIINGSETNEYVVGVSPVLTESSGGGGGNIGTYATSAALQAGSPAAANTGASALVGSAAPYTIYDSNGVAWVARGTGSGGGATIIVSISRALALSDSGSVLEMVNPGLVLTYPTGGLGANFACGVIANGLTQVALATGTTGNGSTSTINRNSSSDRTFTIFARTSDPTAIVVDGTDTTANDSDTQAYVNAVAAEPGATPLTTAQQNAIQSYVTAEKAAGVWALLRRVNPFIGGATSGCGIPLVKVVGAVKDVVSLFAAGDYGDAVGLKTDGTTKFLDTGYTPAVATGGLGAYLRITQSAPIKVSLGAGAASNNSQYLLQHNVNSGGSGIVGQGRFKWGAAYGAVGATTTTNGGTAGYFHGVRRGTNDAELFRNGLSVSGVDATGTTAASPGFPIYVFARNAAGTADSFLATDTYLGYYAITDPMSVAQEAAHYTNVQTLMTALGRNV